MSKKTKSKAAPKRTLGGFGYAVFLLFALIIGTGAGWLNQSDVIRKIIFSPKDPKQTFGSDSVTLLILGCDEDLQDNTGKVLKKQARSDMMLVAKLDFKNHMITGVSIPRDTECQLPGYHRLKINAYHNIAKKGHEAELTQKAVEFLLPGVKIDKVVTLDFDAFQQVVNLVGGVPINSEKKLDYDDNAGHLHIHIKKGFQLMNGYNAMCYVRFRHGDSDFVRQQRQKQFLLAFKGQILKDWTELPTIIDEGVKVIGGALNTDEIASLARFAKSVPPQNIQWGQVPVVDGRGSYLRIQEDKLPDVLAQYRLLDSDSTPATASGDNH